MPAAAVVGEAMVALVLADALLEKFGGDSLAEIERQLRQLAPRRCAARFAAAGRARATGAARSDLAA